MPAPSAPDSATPSPSSTTPGGPNAPPPAQEEPLMTSDHRVTPGLIHEVLDALERHGYYRGDDLHADRAMGLIGDLAGIYEGTQDHPATAYPIAVPAPAYPGASSPAAVTLAHDDAITVFAASD